MVICSELPPVLEMVVRTNSRASQVHRKLAGRLHAKKETNPQIDRRQWSVWVIFTVVSWLQPCSALVSDLLGVNFGVEWTSVTTTATHSEGFNALEVDHVGCMWMSR